MASTKISALPGASTLDGTESIPVVQGGVTKKVTTDQFLIKDGSGNVGIGTASPACRLNIAGYSSATIAPDLLIQRTSTGVGIQSGPNITFQDDSDGTRTVSVQNTQGRFGVWNYNAGWKERLCVDNAGNLGLGVVPKTSTGSYKAFEIGAAGNLSAVVSGVGTTLNSNTFVAAGAIQTYAVTGAAATYELGSGTHAWYTAPSGTAGNAISFTQAMTLDASGNLLVGDTSASGKLHVTNTNNVSGDTAGYFALGSNTNNASSYFLQCVTSGVGGKAYILGNGNLQNANNSYGAFSDVKLKENITDVSPKLSKLMQVRIVNYNLISDPDKTKLIGVVAQELEQVSPGLIEETKDYEEVKKTREVTKSVPVTEQVTVQREQKTVEVVDGKAVVTVTLVDEQTAVPVVDHYPLFDADGQPVLEVDTPEVPEVLDEDGNVTQPAAPATYRQAMHSVPRMQDVTETEEYTERVPLGTVTKSVKYSVFVPMLVKAVQEQQTQIESLAARLAALEAKRWTR